MAKGIAVYLTGKQAAETAKALAMRLVELGQPVERIDGALAALIGNAPGADRVCELLARNGVVVLATYPDAHPGTGVLTFDAEDSDTPDFAADKALDELHDAGVVKLDDTAGYSPEEESQIKKRLAELGYIE